MTSIAKGLARCVTLGGLLLCAVTASAQSAEWMRPFGSAGDDGPQAVVSDSSAIDVSGRTVGALEGQVFRGGDTDAFPGGTLSAGVRIRVARAHGNPANYVFLGSDAQGLSVRPPGSREGAAAVTVPWTDVRKMEKSLGRHRAHRAGKGALIGGLVLGGAFVTLALAAAGAECSDDCGLWASTIAPATLFGAAVGAGIGAVASPERWEGVPLPSTTVKDRAHLKGSFRRGRSAAIAWTVRF
jgi:hypothetical protein